MTRARLPLTILYMNTYLVKTKAIKQGVAILLFEKQGEKTTFVKSILTPHCGIKWGLGGGYYHFFVDDFYGS